MSGVIRLLGLLLLPALAACGGGSGPSAAGSQTAFAWPELPAFSEPIQCVPYARAVSGIEIRGDAWTWWEQAAGHYARGKEPRPGAVLAFTRTNRLPLGHVAVVTRVVHRREILITHANWGSTRATRGRVTKDVRVVDVSPGNDWSQVKVWNLELDVFGRSYPARGFIYPVAVAA